MESIAFMQCLSTSVIPEFLRRRPFSVVHIDADWDGYRRHVAEKIRAIEPQFEETVSFGYVDSDIEQEYVTQIGIRNVPSVAYYRGAELFGLVIGTGQNIAANIERMMRGEPLDETNVISRG